MTARLCGVSGVLSRLDYRNQSTYLEIYRRFFPPRFGGDEVSISGEEEETTFLLWVFTMQWKQTPMLVEGCRLSHLKSSVIGGREGGESLFYFIDFSFPFPLTSPKVHGFGSGFVFFCHVNGWSVGAWRSGVFFLLWFVETRTGWSKRPTSICFPKTYLYHKNPLTFSPTITRRGGK